MVSAIGAEAASPPLTTLHTFAVDPSTGLSADGASPTCSLIAPGDGFLYGTTQYGGAYGVGSVFKVKPDGSAFQTLYFFTSSGQTGADGANPAASLLAPGDGYLYGTTEHGAAFGYGTIFRIRLDGTGYQTIYRFEDRQNGIEIDGSGPQAALIAPGDGFLYSTADFNGALNGGTVYRLHPDGSGFQVVHNFSGGDGSGPQSALVAPGDGFLYGTTSSGFQNGLGSIYRLHPDGTGFQTLYNFRGDTDGAYPSSTLLAPGDGYLYGTNQLANARGGCGTIFKIKLDGTGFQTLLTFPDGQPSASLIVLGDGSLCGLTNNGGTSGLGSVYRLHPDGTGFQVLYDFSGVTDGANPVSSPLVLGDGFLYGTTAAGGANNTGTVFKIPVPSTTHLLWNNADGRVMLWNVAQDGTFTYAGYGPYTDDYVSSDPNNKWHATALAAAPDGTSRLVWNNVDRRVMLWSLDAQGAVLSVTGYGPYTDTYVSSSPGNLWSAVGISVGPDGLTHLLWSNTDRRMMFWDLDAQGDLLGLSGYGPYTDDYVSPDPGNVWSATALATGPDNVSRVVWNNTDNRVMLWTLGGPGGSNVLGVAGYGPYTDGSVGGDPSANKWSAVGVSAGPDNVTHLLWGNTDRRAMFWDVAPDFSFTLAGYGPYTDDAPGNLWSATAVATGPDGLSHILWANTDNRAMLWGVSNAFDFTVAGYGPYTDNGANNLWSATAVSAGP